MTNLNPAAAAARENARTAGGRFGEQHHDDAPEVVALAGVVPGFMPRNFDTAGAVRTAATVHTEETAGFGPEFLSASSELVARLVQWDGTGDDELETTRKLIVDDIQNGTSRTAEHMWTYGIDGARVIEEAAAMVPRDADGRGNAWNLPEHRWAGIARTAAALMTGPNDDPSEMYHDTVREILAGPEDW